MDNDPGSCRNNATMQSMQRRNTNGGGALSSASSSQMQKFSFGNLGAQEQEGVMKRGQGSVAFQNQGYQVGLPHHPQPQVHRAANVTASVYCNSARNPTTSSSSRAAGTSTSASCLQAFTQRHLEAAQAMNTGLTGKSAIGRNGVVNGPEMVPLVGQGASGSPREEGTSVATSNEGNILTFRGSRQFNDSSNRDSMQTDRQIMHQQTTFGNIATARGKPSPGTGSAEISSHALIASTHPNLVQTQQLILSGNGVAGMGSVHQKIQSENGGGCVEENLGRVGGALGSMSESTQLRVSCGGEGAGGMGSGDSIGMQAMGQMAKYLEDHTRGHEMSTCEEGEQKKGLQDFSEKLILKDQPINNYQHNLKSPAEGSEVMVLQTWKKQKEDAVGLSKDSSENTASNHLNEASSTNQQLKQSSREIGYSRGSSSHAANQSMSVHNQTQNFDQGVEQPRQYETERQEYPMYGGYSSNFLNRDLQLNTDAGLKSGYNLVQSGLTSQNKGLGVLSKATTNSMISYYYSNRSNTTNNNQQNTGDKAGRSQGFLEAYGALDPRNSEQQQRLDTFIYHPTTTTITTTNRNSQVSTSLGETRSKAQMHQGVAQENVGARHTDNHEEPGRARLIETVLEQDESSTNSNKLRGNHEQSSSSQFDFSSQVQNFKATDTQNLCPRPSPFIKGSNSMQQQMPQFVIDSENVGKEIPIPFPQQQTSPINKFMQNHNQGSLQPNLSPLLSLSALQRAAKTIAPINSQTRPSGIVAQRQDEEAASQSRNYLASQQASNITSQMDSQDFNEFNANETKSEVEEEELEHVNTDMQYAPDVPYSERADVNLNHLDIIADMPFTDRIYTENLNQQHPISPNYHNDTENFGSSVPNAFRKVVHQPDSLGPLATSSCITENKKQHLIMTSNRKDIDLGSSDGPYTFYKGEREDETYLQEQNPQVNDKDTQLLQSFQPATFAPSRPSDQCDQDTNQAQNLNPSLLDPQVFQQQCQLPTPSQQTIHHRAATSGNHQGGSVSYGAVHDESTYSDQVQEASLYQQKPHGAFLHRSYLKNISTAEEKGGTAREMAEGEGKDHHLDEFKGCGGTSRVNQQEEETQSSVENTGERNDGAAAGFKGAKMQQYCHVENIPRNQNAVLYNAAAENFVQKNVGLNYSQQNPVNGGQLPQNYAQQQQYCNSNGSSNKRVMIERSPLNEKMIIEELINNGYANHDGSQAKNSQRIGNSTVIYQRSQLDNGNNSGQGDLSITRDLVLGAEKLASFNNYAAQGNQTLLLQQTSPQHLVQSECHYQSQPSNSKPQSRTVQLNNQLTNTLPTTDGNGQDDLSERLPSQNKGDEEHQNTCGRQDESNKEYSTLAEVAEEMSYYQGRDLPERADGTMIEMVMRRQQQQQQLQVDQHQMLQQRYQEMYQNGDNRQQSIRDMLDLPKQTKDNSEQIKPDNLVTVSGSQINANFGQTTYSRTKETQVAAPAQGSFDVRRKEKSELQASPSRVMDDQQPEYNSRLENHKKDPSRGIQSQVQRSFDSREQYKLGQQNGIRILVAEETTGQDSKQVYEIAQNFRLVYSYTEFNYAQSMGESGQQQTVYETFKIVCPWKPKQWSVTFTRISASPLASLQPTVTKIHTSFTARLNTQPFPQTPVQRAQLTHDLTRILSHCSASLTNATILVSSKAPKRAPDSIKTQTAAATHRSILDAFTGCAPPTSTKEPRKMATSRSASSRPKSQKDKGYGGAASGSGVTSQGLGRRSEEGVKREGRRKGQAVGPKMQKSVEERQTNVGFQSIKQRGSHAINAVGGGPSLQTSSEKRLNYLKIQGSLSNQGSCESNNSHSVAQRIKSPSALFEELALFKEKNDEKLNSKSLNQDSLVKSKSCMNTKRFSSTHANEHLFFDNFSRAQQKLDTSSKSIKINLKSLAEQSNLQLFNNQNRSSLENTNSPKSVDQRRELIKRLDQRSRSNQVMAANVQVTVQEQTRNSGTAVSKTAKRTEPSNNSIRNLSQRSEKLYQDHFQRQSRLKMMQEKCVRFQAQQNLTERSLPTHKSNQILANKIALTVKTEYDKIIDEIKTDLLNKRRLEKRKRTDMVIEEKSGESGERDVTAVHGSRATGRSAGTTTRNGERSELADQNYLDDEGTDFRPQIEGIDLQRFVQLLSRLHYLSDVSDQRVILQERMAIRNAWQLISHRDWAQTDLSAYGPDTPIANLRNLLILLIGIENIFVESMANSKQLEEAQLQEQLANKSHHSYTTSSQNPQVQCRQQRQIGYFIGQNYFLEGEQDCLKLMQGFNLLVQNKLCYQRERQRLLTIAKLTALQQSENLGGGSFYPSINKKSDQIMSEKSQGALYTRTSQSKAESLERKESLYQHTVGYASSARGTDHLASQKMSKESSTRLKKVGCKYEDFLISKAAQRKIKLEKMAKQATKDETKECTFTPQINKSNSAGLRGVGVRAKSREIKNKQNKENMGFSSQNTACVLSHNKNANNSKEDVFENLYRFAEVRREKSEDGKRTAQNFEKKLLKKQCPFRPNLSKTQKINKSVNSKIYQYKDPDLSPFQMKDQINFQNTQKMSGQSGALNMAIFTSRKVSSTPKGMNCPTILKGLNTTRDKPKQLKYSGNNGSMNIPYQNMNNIRIPVGGGVLTDNTCSDPFEARSPPPYDDLSTTNLLLPSPMTIENYKQVVDETHAIACLQSPTANQGYQMVVGPQATSAETEGI